MRVVLPLLLLLLGVSWARVFPEVSTGVGVFIDQICSGATQPGGLLDFAVSHYIGTQKITRQQANNMRQADPNFLILHYRLGEGLGYKVVDSTSDCNPVGHCVEIIDGTWECEYPSGNTVKDEWHYYENGQQVFMCEWSWWLMNISVSEYQNWWLGQVKQQMADNDNDGLFADSLSVPSFLGMSPKPPLPIVDSSFELWWSDAIGKLITNTRRAFAPYGYKMIPNAGSWVTSRDKTDYSLADGVMIEGFGYDVYASFGYNGAWQLQMDRVMSLTALNRILLGQSYNAGSSTARMFTLASYFMVKANYTYMNYHGSGCWWFPEYDVNLGLPRTTQKAVFGYYQGRTVNAFIREFALGSVAINPGYNTQGSTIQYPSTVYLVSAQGGGQVPSSGVLPSTWTLVTTPVKEVKLQVGQAAIVLNKPL